ncbi:hypothetical protein SFMTTN_2961 [Sulfuriferula multivorans]|uniref:Uncharacterized protein n=1 Tax=Sulfuriferula multivorans TaxID=1559896 RepID=A0A401JYT7_9PROT|nr:hypothetical protein SFMTTN_2961 [Sulfuriferula multivorans]
MPPALVETPIPVSIRTRPIGRVMPGDLLNQIRLYVVSIRTRPIGRVMRSRI